MARHCACFLAGMKRISGNGLEALFNHGPKLWAAATVQAGKRLGKGQGKAIRNFWFGAPAPDRRSVDVAVGFGAKVVAEDESETVTAFIGVAAGFEDVTIGEGDS